MSLLRRNTLDTQGDPFEMTDLPVTERHIVKADAWICPLPLPFPLHLGPISYNTRDYVVVRLESNDGLIGRAVGYGRNTPLLQAVAEMLRQLPGLGADPMTVHHEYRRRFSPGWAALVRAASLVDIALWDIKAAAQSKPLVDALSPAGGSEGADVPLMAVAGYFPDRRPEGQILDEVRRYVDEGYRIIKYMAQGTDPAEDARALRAVRDVLPPGVELAVDFHGVFTDAGSYAAHARHLEDLNLLFVEDPVPSFEIREVASAAGSVPLPLAAGEDLITPSNYADLLNGGVQYLRIDATTVGGFSAAAAGLAAAGEAGRMVLPHVWPHLHAPLAGTSDSVRALEIIPEYVGAEPISLLLSEPMPIRQGGWHSSTNPGLDFPLDWEAVQKYSTEQLNFII
ncbi:mandelate racemase/muconate lactonizing enzyme family protein [Crystallibacter degradans]|uniref:mandelate racemase/muconate lactonizing enzyme family protein n=1 Tax=Crystallibacter degradans TaxID=2726743 RepID=UPI0014727253|nr:enolase C-terminal domain-like protein [Arthrobacter sp. SF27]NMR30532.1 hypothetical protein [Arthrobacter sp. SF27]